MDECGAYQFSSASEIVEALDNEQTKIRVRIGRRSAVFAVYNEVGSLIRDLGVAHLGGDVRHRSEVVEYRAVQEERVAPATGRRRWQEQVPVIIPVTCKSVLASLPTCATRTLPSLS